MSIRLMKLTQREHAGVGGKVVPLYINPLQVTEITPDDVTPTSGARVYILLAGPKGQVYDEVLEGVLECAEEFTAAMAGVARA